MEILRKIYYTIPRPSIESLKMKTTLLSKVTEYLHSFRLLNILSPPIYTLFFLAIKSTWDLCYENNKKTKNNKMKNQILWSNNLLKEQPTFFRASHSLLHPCSLAAASPSAETSPSSSMTKWRPPHTDSLLQLSAPSDGGLVNKRGLGLQALPMKSWLRPLTFPVKDNQFAMRQTRADQ